MEINLSEETIKRIIENLKILRHSREYFDAEKLAEDIEMFEELLVEMK